MTNAFFWCIKLQVHITTNGGDNYAILFFDLFLGYTLIVVSGTQINVNVHMRIMLS